MIFQIKEHNIINISIIIPTLNRQAILKRVIDALIHQSFPKVNYEIIIVDDGSSDSTPQIVSNLINSNPNSHITYLKQNPSKKGPASANNLGIDNAKGKYILFLNDDVIADTHLIEEHMSFHGKYKDIIVQGAVINTSSLEDLGKKHDGYSGGYSNLSFGYFTTWNCSIKKELLIRAGLFDEDFINLCWEDVELGVRLRRMGIKQKNNKNAFGYHFKGSFDLNDLENVKIKSINMGKNAMIYYCKHPSLEVKISTQSFWLPMLIYSFLNLLVCLIGVDKITRFFKYLNNRGQRNILGSLVGLAGYYWYLRGIKSQTPNPKSKINSNIKYSNAQN